MNAPAYHGEIKETILTAAYTGPERRWGTRSLYDWTDRTEHHDNKFALKEAQSLAILDKLCTRARQRGRNAEADALFDGLWEIKQKLQARRKRIADDAAPWFDGSAFPSEPIDLMAELKKKLDAHES